MFDVWLDTARVGVLAPRGEGLTFQYHPAALADAAVPALSLSLPKQTERFPDSKAGRFFRNLLPEQAYRRLVAAAAGTSPENSTALLGAIGGECPGAVSIWPEGTGPSPAPRHEELNEPRLRELLSPAGAQGLALAIARGRLSLAGVQEKIALFREETGPWLLPLDGAVTSHILKEAAPGFPHLLENELFCMALARVTGLPVATTGLASDRLRVFCTERFDRVPATAGGRATRSRIHQEDFCQALAVDPANKYEAEGGPSLKRCAEAIRRYARLPAEDLERLTRWVGFNYLIGNEDAHAKNLALLYAPAGLELSPHYDLVSTEVYAGLERRLAMKLGRSWDIRNVQADDWRRVAAVAGIPWDRFRPGLLDQADRVQAAARELANSAPESFGPSPVYAEIRAVVERKTRQLGERLRG